MFGGKLASNERLFVKICGITNESDAVASIKSGADALGFNIVPQSKRCIDLDAAAAWIGELPNGIWKVAVTADLNWEDACRIAQLPFIDALQLHGNESPEFCRRLHDAGIAFAKALPVVDAESLADVANYFTDTLILDSGMTGSFGGSGKVFPWNNARDFVRKNPALNVILAGGLSPKNVAEAVSMVGPRGVDVTSGVEKEAGRKNHRLVKSFIRAARRAV